MRFKPTHKSPVRYKALMDWDGNHRDVIISLRFRNMSELSL
jgi:hypothetical protein